MKTIKNNETGPCVDCRFWKKSGCSEKRYNSASMIIFGYCGFCEPKKKKGVEVR